MFQVAAFDELESTNDHLKQYYAQYASQSVILAHRQTKGRGRFLRTWESGQDLMFSILFREACPHHLIAPLAVIKALSFYSITAAIKWPNDILVNDKKVCGILIEKLYEGNDEVCTIVGIGVNLSEKAALRDKAGFLSLDNMGLLTQILQEYTQLMCQGMPELLSWYQEVSYLTGRKIRIDDIIWEVQGIDEHGYLMVAHGQTQRTLKSEEITLEAIYKESL